MIKNNFFPLTITQKSIHQLTAYLPHLQHFGETVRSANQVNDAIYSIYYHHFFGGIEYFFNDNQVFHKFRVCRKFDVKFNNLQIDKYDSSHVSNFISAGNIKHYTISVDCRTLLFNLDNEGGERTRNRYNGLNIFLENMPND